MLKRSEKRSATDQTSPSLDPVHFHGAVNVLTSPQKSKHELTTTTVSCFPRASRMARAQNASKSANNVAYDIVVNGLKEIKLRKLEKAPRETLALKSHRHAHFSAKGPGVKVSSKTQIKMNHLASLKAKDVDSHNSEPAFLLGGFNAPMLWDRLAESSLKSNAVNSSVLGRKKTQGAANQTTRINCRSIGQAAAAQVVAVSLAIAECKHRMRKNGVFIVNVMASNAVNPCALAVADLSEIEDDVLFGITSTVRLIYNSSPTKLTSTSVLSVAMELARGELSSYLISNAMCNRSSKLVDICASIVGDVSSVGQLDAVWASWVLLVYLSSHPRGRDILRTTNLTDLDVQSAIAFERYGGEEIRRRARQRGAALKSDDTVDGCGAGESQCGFKRKRNTRSGASSGTSDAFFIIEFWHHALQSEDVSVLHTLAAHSKRTARDAALSTLARQAEGSMVSCNEILQQVSLKNAVKSAQALVSFVGRRESDIPGIVILRAREGHSGQYKTACGFERIDKEGASTAIHACSLPRKRLRPSRDIGISIAHSRAVRKFMPIDEETATLPSVFERTYEMQRNVAGGPKAMREVESNRNFVEQSSDACMPTDAAGTTRSFISIISHMCMNATHESVAMSMEQEANDLHRRVVSTNIPSNERFPTLMGISKSSECRREPIATPASALSVGLGTNEVLRRWMSEKTRKNNPCLKHLGFSMPSELSKDVPGIMSSEPLPLLTITDFEIERLDVARPLADTKFSDAKIAIGLHVCGDGALRIPEVLDLMRLEVYPDSALEYVAQARAALLVAASQSSFVGSVGSSLAAGYTNAAIASSKKISVPDVNKLLLLSPMDCYVAGLNNIQRSFDGTFYSGTYGCRVDTGFTPPGLYSHNLRSDKRQHGNCHLSQETADDLTSAFAKVHWKTFGELPSDAEHKYYTSTPTATRGIPHNFIPRIHSVLNPYCDFIETARKLSGRENADTVDSIMCLPFSAWTQALRPDIEPSSDASLRTCFRDELESGVHSGRAYLVDSTPEHCAIVREPLFRRPQQVSSGDCPFGTSYEEVDSFFNACNTLALLAEAACKPKNPSATPSECISNLATIIQRFVSTGVEDFAESSWAADALLLINCIYPMTGVVGEMALLPALAKAVPKIQQSPSSRLNLVDLVDEGEYVHARGYWSAFHRTDSSLCAWSSGLAPFLTILLTQKGSHKTGPEIVAQVRSALETAVRAVWLVHSEDGIQRPPSSSPASTAKSPSEIARHHIDPIFVGDEDQGLLQRGAIIGLKTHSYRQVLAEMMGAHIEGVECNVAQNSGGMALRVSSDPTILEEDGKERTEKSISPTQTEGDEAAYGSRRNKINGAFAQKAAWDQNAILGKPLFVAIEKPHCAEIRSRGEFGHSTFFQLSESTSAQDHQPPSRAYVYAKNAMAKASIPTVAALVNPCL